MEYEGLEVMLGGLFAFLGVIMLIVFAVAIFMIIANWKIFEKAEKPGWAAIIPIYNMYTLFNIVGVNPWWILIVILSPILGIVPILGSLAQIAVVIYFQILVNVSLARAFDKEDGFAVGLILLPIVFYPILAFGTENKYSGKKPMHDILFDNMNNNNSNVNEAKYEENTKYCSSCGAKTNTDTKYCPKCGKEM